MTELVIKREDMDEMIEQWRDKADSASELGYWEKANGIGYCALDLEGFLRDDENTEQFTKRERNMIMQCVKLRRFSSDEMYSLYEKVSGWSNE